MERTLELGENDKYYWHVENISSAKGGRKEVSVVSRAGTNTPSDEYDSYREYRVANTNMYSRIQ